MIRKLKLGVIALSVLGIICAVTLIQWQPANSAPTPSQAIHLLNRLSFGPTPGDIQQVQQIGIDAYIQAQLHPESLPNPAQLSQKLNQLSTLKLPPEQLLQTYSPQGDKRKNQSDATKKKQQQQARKPLQEAIEARLLRAVMSPQQLQEVLTDFWFNHFNVAADKGKTKFWVGNYEAAAIRPHVLGQFRDLLAATARHPAMLFYLDNWRNSAPGSPGAKGQFKGLNENYARELMELHTLGVHGGYSQADVVTLARILTGWGIVPPGQPGAGKFFFDQNRHDSSNKVFLGQSITGQGIAEVEQALDLLAQHPATAQHISYKLAQYFVADDPPEVLVDRLAQTFRATQGNLRVVLETLFQSDQFWEQQYYGQKFRTPYQYIISLLRATETPTAETKSIDGWLKQMGMPLYKCSTPDGYKNTQGAWLSPDAMTRRLSLALSLGRGNLRHKTPVDTVQLKQTLDGLLSPKTAAVVDSHPANLQASLILGSPEMMNR
ncbi:MAG: DUF1800 domain-containing protein [Oscillatoriales cyanobacterium RM2_1_1]|nr:DUF1800 domain-containing protein [Oscillatoriales cyanobacterium RM2_1_1]